MIVITTLGSEIALSFPYVVEISEKIYLRNIFKFYTHIKKVLLCMLEAILMLHSYGLLSLHFSKRRFFLLI